MNAPIARNRPSAVFHRNLKSPAPEIARGDGVYLIDREGKRYIDASGGPGVSCLGHTHPRVIAALHDQLARIAYAHNGFFTSEPAEELARRLLDRAPAPFGDGRVMFVGSGSEATEAALKLVRQHFVEKGEPERSRIVSRRMSFHGNTLGALAVGGHLQRRALYQPLLVETTQIAPCYAYRFQRDDESATDYGRRVADELEAAILRLGPETVAAFIAEPIVGATLGTVPAVPGYFRRIREICDRYGVLFIADEVMCGMGRSGALFCIDQEGVVPDLITVAKGLGAGYAPIAAVLARESVVAPIAAGTAALAHGHTYMAHALCCAGALAVLETIEADGLLANVAARGAELEAKLRSRLGSHPHVGDIRGRGLFWTLEMVKDRATKQPFDPAIGLAAKIRAEGLRQGMICYPSSGTADGRAGDHVLLAPPFIATAGHIDEIVEKLDRTVAATLKAIPLAA